MNPAANGLASAAATIEDVELYLVAPDLTTTYRVERQVTEMRLMRGPLLQDTFYCKAKLDSDVCTSANGTSTAMRDDWQGWAFMLYVRGVLKFDGPIVGTKTVWAGHSRPDEDIEFPGSHVELAAEHWFTHTCRRRYVATTNGAQYALTDKPNRIFCDLVRKSTVSGAVTTPTDWQQGSEARYDMGAYTVACSLPVAAGTDLAYVQDAGNNLLDALLELCNMPSADADKLWPACTRSGTTVTISVLRGRSGVGRQIGTDKSTSASSGIIEVSADRGNLLGYSRETDRTKKENHINLNGKGRRTGQIRDFVADTSDVGDYGVFEGWEVLEHARTVAELTMEGNRLLFERVRGIRKEDFNIGEVDGFQWPTDFDVADSLAVVLPVGARNASGTYDPTLVETNIIGLEWSLVGKGPAKIKFTLGQWPRTPERDLARSGGGGGGGRGGGGRPRKKSGESDVDPDDIKGYYSIATQSGDVDAEESNNFLDYRGKWNDVVLRVTTSGIDSGDSESSGTPDKLRDAVVFTTTASGDITPNCYGWIYSTNLARWVQVLCWDPGGGGIQPSPTENT